jgi:membrane-bound lytic murein transglycosylase D
MTGEHVAGPRQDMAAGPGGRPPNQRRILGATASPPMPGLRRARRGVAAAAALVALVLAGCSTAPTAPAPTVEPATAPSTAAAAPTGPVLAPPTAMPDTLSPDGAPFAFAVDPEQPARPYDFSAPGVHTDLWQRVRAGFAIADLQNELVGKWEQWYAGRPDYVARMTERGSRYLFYIVEEIDKRGMPTELALLPFIESAFNPQAMSVARASGMWQFMPATGKDFDLKQNLFRDDRRDVLQSTRAALDYLQMLHQQFGDWQLALAAYNWGQGNVQRAIARNQKAGLAVAYEALRMPDETRNYVPKLQAVKNIVLQPQAFALTLPRLENHPYFLGVPITRDIDVAVAARLAGISVEEFQQLNPQMNKPVILAAGTPQVLLPFDNANRFVRNLDAHRGPLATWTAWIVPTTLRPADAARRLGLSEDELRSANRIPPRVLIKAGSTLLVPRDGQRTADVPEEVADNASMVLAPDRPPGRRIAIRADKSGHSVASIARRYGVSAEQVAQWNGVSTGARFKAGQTIIVYRPARAAPARTAATRSGPASRSAKAATGSAKKTAATKPKRPAATSAKSKSGARPVASSDGTGGRF